MHAVALIQCLLDADDKAERIVRVLGVTPAEARQHAMVALPRVIATRSDGAAAGQLALDLQLEGLVCVVVDGDSIVTDARRFIARTFRVDDDGVPAERKDGATAALAWGDVAIAVPALRQGGKASIDLLDEGGNALCMREGATLFDAGTGTGTIGARANVLALAQLARQKSNARVDDRLTKPNAVPAVLGGLASAAHADDWASAVVARGLIG
jgi:hypothetical protein